jgi:hypothetical protein
VDAAIADHDYPRAQRAVDDLIEATEAAEAAGSISGQEAARIVDAANVLVEAMPEAANESPSSSPEPEEPSIETPEEPADEEEGEGEEGEGEEGGGEEGGGEEGGGEEGGGEEGGGEEGGGEEGGGEEGGGEEGGGNGHSSENGPDDGHGN